MSVKGVANAVRVAAVRLSADVSVRPLSTSLVALDQRIAASYTASNILAGIVPAHTHAAIAVPAAQLAYDLGVWLTHLRYQDSFGVMDKALLSFFKTKTENLQLAEDVTTQFYKTLRETCGLTDKQIFSVFKKLVDEASVEELYQMRFARSRFEQAGATDAYQHILNKQPKETAGVRDLQGFTLYKGFSEAGAVAESSLRVFTKNNYELARFTELRQKSFSKSLKDFLNATDDVDGAASILDDQEIQFIKQRTDLGSVSDSFAFAMSYVRAYADSYKALDKITFGFVKTLLETSRFSDSKSFVFSKKLADSFGSRDVLAKAMARPITDNARAVDLKAFALSKARTDAATLSDSGSLRSQGYCDFSYFSEDYVGTFRTF